MTGGFPHGTGDYPCRPPLIGHSESVLSGCLPLPIPFALPSLTGDIDMSRGSPAAAFLPPAHAALSPPEATNTYAKTSILICV